MRNFQNLSKLIIVIVLAFNLSDGYAQKGEFIEGLVILLNGDTIQTKILRHHKDSKGIKSSSRVTTKEGNVELKYRPKDIKGYIRGEEVYESKKIPNRFGKSFVRRIETGYLNLYCDNYWSLGDDLPFLLNHDYKYYIQKDSEKIKHCGGNTTILFFKKIFAKYFKDCPEVSENILKKVEGFRQKDIRNIVHVYNNCMEGK